MNKISHDKTAQQKGLDILLDRTSDENITILGKIAGLSSNPLVAKIKVSFEQSLDNIGNVESTRRRYDIFLSQRADSKIIEELVESVGLGKPTSVTHYEGHSYFIFGAGYNQYEIRFH